MLRLRVAIANAWRAFLWRCRDRDFDSYDLRDVRMRNGLIYRTGPALRTADLLPAGDSLLLVDAVLTPLIADGDSVLVRIPMSFLHANEISLHAGDELQVSRSGSRSLVINAR